MRRNARGYLGCGLEHSPDLGPGGPMEKKCGASWDGVCLPLMGETRMVGMTWAIMLAESLYISERVSPST